MYEELYAPLPDKAAYLARIGLSEAGLRPDLECLNAVLRAQLEHIPFENLEVLCEQRTPDLGTAALFDKLVTRRRGGYCFELNALFHALLVSLGYTVYPVAVRVQLGGSELSPTTHRGEVAVIGGRKYYCDVGFGAISFPHAVPLDGSETPEGFRIVPDGAFLAVQQKKDGAWALLMRFADLPTDPVDFVLPNFYTSRNPEGLFRQVLSVAILRGGVRVQLAGDTLREYEGKTVLSERKAKTPAALTELLREEFGIEYELKRAP